MNDLAGDQTRGDSTAFLDGSRMAALSCNEIAALCLKAARGAGMSWGLAEEAGYAAVWLARHGIDGPGHLRRHLARTEGRAWVDICPVVTPGAWRAAPGRSLCPVALGVTLSDHAALPEGLAAGRKLRLGPVDSPVLLLPFLTEIAMRDGLVIDLAWDDGTATLGGARPWAVEAARALGLGPAPLSLSLTASARRGASHPPKAVPPPPTEADTIAALNALAMRTTVPASDASRAGAGSATTDND
jgi:hypothetical protein